MPSSSTSTVMEPMSGALRLVLRPPTALIARLPGGGRQLWPRWRWHRCWASWCWRQHPLHVTLPHCSCRRAPCRCSPAGEGLTARVRLRVCLQRAVRVALHLRPQHVPARVARVHGVGEAVDGIQEVVDTAGGAEVAECGAEHGGGRAGRGRRLAEALDERIHIRARHHAAACWKVGLRVSSAFSPREAALGS